MIIVDTATGLLLLVLVLGVRPGSVALSRLAAG
jgi:hypothetical protein